MKKHLNLLISSALVTLTCSMPQIVLGMDDFSSIGDPKNPLGIQLSKKGNDAVDHHTVKTMIEKHLKKNPNLLNSSKNKDIIVFLGNTGAGKSTLVNYLSKRKLIANKFYDIVLEDPNDTSAMAIGGSGDSETFLPGFIQADDLLFYDLPGFKDTRGTATSLVNACLIKSIIENAKSAKLMFVLGMDQINSDKGESFKNLLSQAQQLIPNQSIENFSSLIITKSDQEDEDLVEYIKRRVATTQLTILQFWMSNGKIGQLSKPKEKGKQIAQHERENILNLIREKTTSKKINDLNIGVVYDAKDQNNIKKIYDKEIDNTVANLIRKKFNSDYLSSLDVGTLEKKKQYLQNTFAEDVSLSIEESSLINLLRPISTDIYQLSRSEVMATLFPRLIKIFTYIDYEIKNKEKKESERRRIEEEEKRIQTEKSIKEHFEKLVEQAERRATETQIRYKEEKGRRVQAENEIKEIGRKHQEEINQRLQAEQKATIAEARRGDIEKGQQAEENRRIQAEKETKERYEKLMEQADTRIKKAERQHVQAEEEIKSIGQKYQEEVNKHLQAEQKATIVAARLGDIEKNQQVEENRRANADRKYQQEIDNLTNKLDQKTQEAQKIKEEQLYAHSRHQKEVEKIRQENNSIENNLQSLKVHLKDIKFADETKSHTITKLKGQLEEEQRMARKELKERGALVHNLVFQIPVDVENLKQSKQKLATVTASKAHDTRPAGRITTNSQTVCKKNVRYAPGAIKKTVPPTQAEVNQWEQRQQNFDNQIQQLKLNIESATEVVLKKMSEYAKYTEFPHPLWQETELSYKKEIFAIRESGISNIFTQYKILCSSNLTYGQLGKILQVGLQEQSTRVDTAKLANTPLHFQLLCMTGEYSLENGWDKARAFSNIEDMIRTHSTHTIDAPTEIEIIKNTINNDLSKSMDIYKELHGKAHPHWEEFIKFKK